MRERHPLYQRLGKFLVLEEDADALPDWLQQMMQRVIVLRATNMIERGGIEYVALCPEFSISVPYCMPYEYRPVIVSGGGRFLRFELGMGGPLWERPAC